MSHILVVDDSPDQARLISTLLEAAEYTVEVAPNGSDALDAIARRRPELVLTDLIMPEMNGLQLVEAIRENYASIPVILMTAYGSGEIAMKALKNGAASYVPKRKVTEDLVDTVESTLSLVREQREQLRVVGCLERSEYRFLLENDHKLVSALVGYLQDSTRLRYLGDPHTIQIGIAIQEALLNGMIHGNLEVGSDLRRTDIRAYYSLIDERRRDPRLGARRVDCRIRLSSTELHCMIRDEGHGFDPSEVPDPTDPSNLETVCGRGLYLIGMFMDKVQHNDIGNEITLTKHFDAGAKPQESRNEG